CRVKPGNDGSWCSAPHRRVWAAGPSLSPKKPPRRGPARPRPRGQNPRAGPEEHRPYHSPSHHHRHHHHPHHHLEPYHHHYHSHRSPGDIATIRGFWRPEREAPHIEERSCGGPRPATHRPRSDLDLLVLDDVFDGGTLEHAILERRVVLEFAHRKFAAHTPGGKDEAGRIGHRGF